jgi:hypothetical protein
VGFITPRSPVQLQSAGQLHKNNKTNSDMPYNFEDDYNDEDENQESGFTDFPLRNIPGHLTSLFIDLSNMIDFISQTIENNYDDRVKEVGDRVVVWDGSSLTTIEGDDAFIIDEPFTTSEFFIVSETNQEYKLVSVINEEDDGTEIEYHQDLVIVDVDTRMKYRVSSDHVSLYEIEGY